MNGFASADEALKNGLAPQVKYLGLTWYVSNDNTADHAMAGVRKIQHLGILKGTFGRMHKFPGIAGTSGGIQSGIAYHSRVDIGFKWPLSRVTLIEKLCELLEPLTQKVRAISIQVHQRMERFRDYPFMGVVPQLAGRSA